MRYSKPHEVMHKEFWDTILAFVHAASPDGVRMDGVDRHKVGSTDRNGTCEHVTYNGEALGLIRKIYVDGIVFTHYLLFDPSQK